MTLLKNFKIVINKKVELYDIFNLLVDFRAYYNQKKLT